MSGKIPIAAARTIAQKHGCPVVIIFGIGAKGEQFHLATYGESKALCRHAASLAEQIAQKILGGDITPAAREPKHLPDEPMQFVGPREGHGLLGKIDTANAYAVSRDSDGLIRVLLARLLAVRALSPEQALGLAAWLLVLSDPDSAVDIADNGTRFGEVVEAMLDT